MNQLDKVTFRHCEFMETINSAAKCYIVGIPLQSTLWLNNLR